MRLQQLRAKYTGLVAQMQQLSDLIARDGRAMTEDERAQFTALDAEAEQVKADVAAEERLQTRLREMPASAPADADVAAHARSVAAAGLVVGQDLSEADPKKGFKSHREFLTAIMEAGRGRREDTRLKPLKQRAAAGSDEAGSYSDPHGGFLVPEGFSPTLLQLRPEDDFISGRVQTIPMATPVVALPARVDKNHTSSVSGGLTVTRRPETVAGTSSRTEFEKVTLRATSLFGLSYATEEIMTDSPISFVALLANGFSQEFASKLTDERLNGSGVGEFEGVLNSPAKVAQAKEAGQKADTILYENVTKMRSRVWGYRNAIWIGNYDTMPQLMTMVQVVGTGGAPIYQPSAREDAPDLLLGRPIFYTEYAKTVGDEGDLLCVNFAEYLDGTYQPLQSAESMHVRFVEHERAFKFWLRNDGKCWWRSALTPKNSTVTLSPIVTLAARA